MCVRPLGRLMADRLEQLRKAYAPRLVRVVGRLTLVRLLQDPNALSSISITPSETVMLVGLLVKQYPPIALTV